MAAASIILDSLRSQIDLTDFKKLNWEGSFTEYLDIVLQQPGVTRTAYQRLYDMIMSHGTEDIYENKDKQTRYTTEIIANEIILLGGRGGGGGDDSRPRAAAVGAKAKSGDDGDFEAFDASAEGDDDDLPF